MSSPRLGSGVDDDVGKYTALVLDPDGNPVVSYFEDTNNALKLVQCDDPECAGTETPTLRTPSCLPDTGSR